LYNQKIAAPVDEIEREMTEDLTYDNEDTDISNENELNKDTESCPSCENVTEGIKECDINNKSSPLSHLFSDLPIGNILSSINKEDLLLLGLILLMATEKNGANNDILTMLSLLLLKHK
jgi:hypothetical protein